MGKKELGQVWTPDWVVRLILDQVGYTVDNPGLLQAKVLEPSFGAGVFFFEIVDRLLAVASAAGLSSEEQTALLGENIWGVEYDAQVHAATISELNAHVSAKGVRPPAWNLLRQDALTFEHRGEFDYVVGNPPYIRVHNMDETMRQHVKAFAHGTGTTDLYVLFFELGLRALKEGGVLGYITPNSFMRNTSQRTFRAHLLAERLLDELIDFGSEQIFADAATYAAITILSKKRVAPETFTYAHRTAAKTYEVHVEYATVADLGAPLVFSNEEDALFLRDVASRKRSLGDLLSVQYGVATLRDKIYTAPVGVEEALLRPVVKGSTYKGGPVSGQIVFPYAQAAGGQLAAVPEAMLAADYPGAHAFFKRHEQELLARDRDAGALWYAYGRSQGLANIAKPKLTLSHVVSQAQRHVAVHEVSAETVVYSGLFITAVPGGLTLAEIKAALESEDFCRFVRIHGKDMAGGYKSFTAKTLKAYRIA